MTTLPFSQSPRRCVDGFVMNVRLYDVIQPGQVLNTDPDGITYDVFIHGVNNTINNLKPRVRVATGVKINSAMPGQPCLVTIEQGSDPIISIFEEIVFIPCTPNTTGGGNG